MSNRKTGARLNPDHSIIEVHFEDEVESVWGRARIYVPSWSSHLVMSWKMTSYQQ